MAPTECEFSNEEGGKDDDDDGVDDKDEVGDVNA